VSKIRKQSGGKYDPSELFADEDFDADVFVEHMEDKKAKREADAPTGWRRIEELREKQMLREQLLDLEDWDDFGTS
jgi:hypothetical protein